MTRIKKLWTYARAGLLVILWRQRYASYREAVKHTRWHGAVSEKHALRFFRYQLLQQRSRGDYQDQSAVLLLTNQPSQIEKKFRKSIVALGLQPISLPLAGCAEHDFSEVGGVFCLDLRQSDLANSARFVVHHPILQNLPFEYVSCPQQENVLWQTHLSRDSDPMYMMPRAALSGFGNPNESQPDPRQIYAESLQTFTPKCGVPDFLDLFQCLQNIVRQKVPGAIAEFGTFYGHGGYLIANSLVALGEADRPVYLFDAFGEFPSEGLGIDQFWSGTHHVDFESVKAKFTDLPSVQFVKGDLTTTFPTSGVEQVALAYVDCDSYRATAEIIPQLLNGHLADYGMIIIEDYGHPALLGSRVAVEEIIAQHPNLVSWYSQFSGLFMLLKLPKAH